MNIDKEKLTAEVVKYQNGDGNAFEAIYNLTNKAAYFTAMKIVKNEDDAQDVLQDSYVKALEKLATLDKPESFMSWFNMIVANNAKNYLAKNRSGRFVDTKVVIDEDEGEEVSIVELIEDKDECFIPEASTENTELCNDVMSLIEGLSDDKRTAVVLYYYNEMTTKQIAESLGVNENTIKSRLVQAKKDLAAGIHALEKKNKSILGIAPMSVVRWALNYNGSDAYQKDMPDFAPLLEKIQGLESQGFSVLEKLKFRVADLFSHFGSGAGAGHDRSAVMKSAAAIVATAGVVGGAVAGTNAIKNRDKTPPAETTTAYVDQVDYADEQMSKSDSGGKKDDTIYLFVDKDKKKIDSDVEIRQMKYGVCGSFMIFFVKKGGATETDEKRPTLDRSGFSATYEELLPAANENKAKYASMINSTVEEINNLRSGMTGLALDDTLTEQANVRAEEIAWSGKDFAIRPDGSDYTTVFEQNGMSTGTRLECRAYNYSSSAEAAKIWNDNENKRMITNPLITKIGVGVAENPETGKYVFVVHLYSPYGSEALTGNNLLERFRYNYNDNIDESIGKSFNIAESSEGLADIPVIGQLLSIDIPIDGLVKSIVETLQEINENKH